MDRFRRSNRLRVLGLLAWMAWFVAAGYLYGFVGIGIVMCLTTAGLAASLLYRQTQHSLSRSRLYREGGNHVTLFGLGLLSIGQTLDGWVATTVGVAAYALVLVGIAGIARWWRGDWDDEPTADYELDQ